jgi:hypothetical protein
MEPRDLDNGGLEWLKRRIEKELDTSGIDEDDPIQLARVFRTLFPFAAEGATDEELGAEILEIREMLLKYKEEQGEA